MPRNFGMQPCELLKSIQIYFTQEKKCKLNSKLVFRLPLYFLIFCNEPELGVGIDPGMALTPLPSSIGQGSNPRPSDCELSALPLDQSLI